MPFAVPLTRVHYAHYLRTEPGAPRREVARTHEVKGQKRHGEGVAYRLFGPHAVVLGRWTGRAMTEQESQEYQYQSQEGERYSPWGRLIDPDEIDTVARQIVDDKFREGWNPPRWHWRYYWELVSGFLNNVGLMNVAAYNSVRWTPRRFLRLLYDRLKMRMFGKWEPEPDQSEVEEHPPYIDPEQHSGRAI